MNWGGGEEMGDMGARRGKEKGREVMKKDEEKGGRRGKEGKGERGELFFFFKQGTSHPPALAAGTAL